MFLYKQVIISCEFCQHFKYLEVLLSSWMSLWYLDNLGTWVEVLKHLEKFIVLRDGFFLRFCKMIIIR